MSDLITEGSAGDIAVIGMMGRFPGAYNLDQFWQNLLDGVESVSFFSDQDVEAAGVDPAILNRADYVKAWAALEDMDLFDASFFGYSPKEVELMDPQHRIFLECAWEALESAGYDSERYGGAIGVFAGMGMDYYFLSNLYPDTDLMARLGWQIRIGNSAAFLSTCVSYKMNLRGPSLNVQTACSTSLVAVCLACQSLQNYQCDTALAGGVSIRVPQEAGYMYQEGGILSPDGHCRAFDARAQGTVPGNGAGVVVLKRLQDALAERDTIHAIIKGSAVNNDGALKAGYMAPSVNSQAEVIATAQALAGISPETITYVEAHGTGTALGDPIEVAALTQAFRLGTARNGYCAIGSVKTNIGHLDAAAGIAGFIKTVLALQHKWIPPSLHFEHPNPKIDFSNSPFYVNAASSEWKVDGLPRRAGVSSFGIGGTNAHVVLEEAPAVGPSGPTRSAQLLVLSAKTRAALDTATDNLAAYLEQHPDLDLADAAYTLQVGRRAFSHRRMLICQSVADAVSALKTKDPQRVASSLYPAGEGQRPVAFLFPGLGDHYMGMAHELYRSERTFRESVDHCASLLVPHLGLDLRDVLFSSRDLARQGSDMPTEPGMDLRQMLGTRDPLVGTWGDLGQTHIAQPAVFVIEYALAQMWMAWGIHPQAMIGHSLGEYVAACLAGVFSLPDALALVAKRARWIGTLAPGSMLAVPFGPEELQPFLTIDLSLAAINGPSLCVVAGPPDAVGALEEQLTRQKIVCRRLPTAQAFHSKMMAPLADEFARLVETIQRRPPQVPYLSNVTGTWITADQAMNPHYWAQHLCQSVRFSDGVEKLLSGAKWVLLEVGPGQSLLSFARLHPGWDDAAGQVGLPSLRSAYNHQSDTSFLLNTLGKLWLAGIELDWAGFYAQGTRRRIPLPTYPFERERYWIESPRQGTGQFAAPPLSVSGKSPQMEDWFFTPTWQQTLLPSPAELDQGRCWLVFMDPQGLGAALVERLRSQAQRVITVVTGKVFEQSGHDAYTLNPQERADYRTLFQCIGKEGRMPDVVAHLWSLTAGDVSSNLSSFEQMQDLGYYSVLFLIQALAQQDLAQPVRMGIITNALYEVDGNDMVAPEKATLLGLCKVAPQEYSNLACICIDVTWPDLKNRQKRLEDWLIAELVIDSPNVPIAYRGGKRWAQTFMPLPLRHHDTVKRPLREHGVYLITGGLGNVGYTVGRYLARTLKARLVLCSRSGLPPRDQWADILAQSIGEDRIAQRIRRVQHLEALGAEVMVAGVDVTQETQLRDLVAQVYDRFGQLNGVLHAAGVIEDPSASSPIAQVGRTESEVQFHPKAHGLYVLENALADREIDFCLLFSSNAAVLGGLGFTAYAAANAFMDSFALCRNRTCGFPWTSANWDPWPAETSPMAETRSQVGQYAMTLEESQEAFRRVTCLADGGQVVVATGDFSARLDLWVRRVTRPERQVVAAHKRPALASEYIPPRDKTEETIAAIWTRVLGVEEIGIYDNFFDLGGHSLLAMQVLNHLRQAFGVQVSLRSLFERATVADIADLVRQSMASASEKKDQALIQSIQIAFPTERKILVEEYLGKLVSDLGIQVDQFPPSGWPEGFDLESVADNLTETLNLALSPHEIAASSSFAELTRHVLSRLEQQEGMSALAEEGSRSSTHEHDEAKDILPDLDQLTEEEIDAMLDELLANRRRSDEHSQD